MALTGLSVTFGFDNAANLESKQPLFEIDPAKSWSEEPTSGSATTKIAVAGDGRRLLFHVTAKADGWIAVGPNTPSASASPRMFIASGTERDIPAIPGWKLAWLADA